MKMRTIVDKLTEVIANRKYSTLEQGVDAMQLSQVERKRSRELVQRDKSVIVSCQGMKGVVTLCLDMNKRIHKELEESVAKGDRQTARKMILANALLVYELLDFAIGFIEDFKVLGVDEIHRLYERATAENQRLLKQEAKREKDASASNIKPVMRDDILSDVNARRDALKVLADAWKKYVQDVDEKRDKAMNTIDENLPFAPRIAR